MTLDDMKTLLAGRLGQRTDIDNMIYSEIRQAQRTLEKTPPYPWFLQIGHPVEYSEQGQPLPDGFIEMYDDVLYLRKATTDMVYYNPAIKVYGAHLEHTEHPGDIFGHLGRPKNFVIFADWIYLFPVPDISYTFSIEYYKQDTTLDGPGSENKWSTKAEDLLIAEAGWHVARNIRDNEAATMFGQDRAEARRRMAQENTSRVESMRRAIIGAGEDAHLGQQVEISRS